MAVYRVLQRSVRKMSPRYIKKRWIKHRSLLNLWQGPMLYPLFYNVSNVSAVIWRLRACIYILCKIYEKCLNNVSWFLNYSKSHTKDMAQTYINSHPNIIWDLMINLLVQNNKQIKHKTPNNFLKSFRKHAIYKETKKSL